MATSRPRMTIQVLSDLHLEFLSPASERDHFIDSLVPPQAVDVLVLAGDVASHDLLPPVLRRFAQHYRSIILVLGNHEFYRASFPQVRQTVQSLGLLNVQVLDNGVVEIQGRRFVGTTLWFPNDPLNVHYRDRLSDFHQIEDFGSVVYGENRRAVDFLHEKVRPGDIVITHHLPSRRSIAERFLDDPITRFFVCDVEELITERQPALWVHGHTHDSFDYQIGRTRVVCNPYGYPHEVNPVFNRHLTIEMD